MTHAGAEALRRGMGAGAEGSLPPAVADLVGKGREHAEQLAGVLRAEVVAQASAAGLATRDDIARLQAQLEALTARVRALEAAEDERRARRAAKDAAKQARAGKATKKSRAAKEAGHAR